MIVSGRNEPKAEKRETQDMMTTTYSEPIERQAGYQTYSVSNGIYVGTIQVTLAPSCPWWQILTVRTWYGFGMRNLTVRFRGVVVLKLAVR